MCHKRTSPTNTYGEEDLQIAAETSDSSTSGEEREDIVGSVGSAVEVPSVPSQAHVGFNGHWLAARAVAGGDGTGVEVGEPDHDFVHVRAPGRV